MSDRIYRPALTEEEFITLNYTLKKGIEQIRAHPTHKGSFWGEISIKAEDAQNLKAISARLKFMSLWKKPETPPIDMATVNNAFERIRKALNDVDQVINPQEK